MKLSMIRTAVALVGLAALAMPALASSQDAVTRLDVQNRYYECLTNRVQQAWTKSHDFNALAMDATIACHSLVQYEAKYDAFTARKMQSQTPDFIAYTIRQLSKS